jgi:23S rRNA (uracil1939-C5)-methyltransferase
MAPRVACPHADRCGGCPLIEQTYDDQLARKHARVTSAFARYPALEATAVEPMAAAEPLVGYRTRAKLMVAPGGAVGLYAKGGGHHVVDIPECRVLAPALAEVARVIREQIGADERAGGPLAPFGPEGGALRAVDLREVREGPDGASRALVTFVVARSRGSDLAPLRQAATELIARAPAVLGVAANFHDGDNPQVLGAETVPLAGARRAADRVGASVHFATFGSFVQAHRGQAARVHARIAAAVGLGGQPARGRGPRVLDLYGGSGAIGLGLAAAGARVTLVESFAPAVEQAAAAAREQRLDVETICGDAATVLRDLAGRRDRFDAIVVNPPRRGIAPRAREALALLEPETVAYVSCDPETLARDLAHLARLGFATASLQPYDMIPLTEEVETVAVARRAPVPLPEVVYEDADLLVVDKAAHEPATPQGGYAGSLLARVRKIAGASGAAPVNQLDVEASGLVVFARRGGDAPRWQRALAADSARVTLVAAVRGRVPAKGRIAGARYRRLAVASGHSLLRVTAVGPETARSHSIRRAFAAIGHPLLGDDRHGHAPTNRHFEERFGLDRAFLHCARLEIARESGAPVAVEAPLPGDLASVIERLGVVSTEANERAAV